MLTLHRPRGLLRTRPGFARWAGVLACACASFGTAWTDARAEPAAAYPAPAATPAPVITPDPGIIGPLPRTGATIRSITIEVRDIFEREDEGSFYREVNALKPTTKEFVVRRELVFKEGDPFDPFVVQESVRNLRNQRFIRDPLVTFHIEGDSVDIKVSVQDTWTLIPQVSYSTGTGRTKRAVGLADSNALGYGKRAEVLLEQDEQRNSLEFVYDDNRVWGTPYALGGAFLQRSDGDIVLLEYGRPFRTLLDKEAWATQIDYGDTVGRLFEAGEEDYIFRQRKLNVAGRFTQQYGQPNADVRRYSLGWAYQEADFLQADDDDYGDLDLDPDEVSNDPLRLAQDRRFSGPTFGYLEFFPEYVSMNYIDRFDRVEDYDVGFRYGFDTLLSLEGTGGADNHILLNGSVGDGFVLSPEAFWRADIGATTRLDGSHTENSIFRVDLKYYQAFDPYFAGDWYLGRHTFAARFALDYGNDLDEDYELTAGGDNAIRGYKARTLNGQSRYFANIEDRVHLADDVFQLVSIGAAAFLDLGSASDDSIGQMFSDDTLADVGMGLRFAFPRSSGGRVFRVDVAFPLRDGPDGSSRYEPRIIFSGGQIFGAPSRSESFGNSLTNVAVGQDD